MAKLYHDPTGITALVAVNNGTGKDDTGFRNRKTAAYRRMQFHAKKFAAAKYGD